MYATHATHATARRHRTSRLRHLAGPATAPPHLDDDGILRYAGFWVAVPDGQLEAVRLLLERSNRVVRTDAVRAAYLAAGGSDHPRALKGFVSRVVDRFAEVGLDVRTIRGRGLLLEVPTAGAPPV